jgi:hypothetical protein
MCGRRSTGASRRKPKRTDFLAKVSGLLPRAAARLFVLQREGDSLSEMALDRELANFIDVYNDRSDAELMALHENRDDLTDLAQQALAQVMKERGLSVTGVPVAEPAQDHSAAVDEALGDDEVELQTFDDAFRLNEALRLLTVAEIPHRVVNWDEVMPSRSNARGMLQLGLIVGKDDYAQAKKLLQAEMKLFPQGEGDGAVADEADGLTMLGVLSRPQAQRIAQLFGIEGISFLWTDGREVFTLEEEEVSIEVYKKSVERARELLKQTLGG